MQRVNETKFRKFVPNSSEDLKFTKHYVALDFRLSGVLLVEVVHTRMSSPRPCHFLPHLVMALHYPCLPKRVTCDGPGLLLRKGEPPINSF